jgi:hypothetical protein
MNRFVVLLLLAGCSGEIEPVDCADEACFAALYFADLPPVPRCSPANDRLGKTLALSLFHGGRADDHDVRTAASRLQRFYRDHDLTLRTGSAARDAGLAYAMSGSASAVDEALAAAGVPGEPATPEEERRARQAVGSVVFADLRAFVQRRMVEDPGGISLVVVDDILAPGLSTTLFGSEGVTLLGFAVSPALLDGAPADAEAELREMTGLPRDFPPALFVARRLPPLGRAGADNVVAHELGHALGLAHSGERGNVMSPGLLESDCHLTLSPPQLDELRRQLRSR